MESKGLDPIQMGRENEGPGQATPRTAHAEKGFKGTGTRQRSAKEIDVFRICREKHTGSYHRTGE